MRREREVEILRAHRGEFIRLGIESLRRFGSLARGEAGGESDVDVLVGSRTMPSFSRFMKARIFLEDLIGSKLDLVTEDGLRERVRPAVESEAIRVA